jgi:hypothetical protein
MDTTVHCITVPTGAFVIEREGNMCAETTTHNHVIHLLSVLETELIHKH